MDRWRGWAHTVEGLQVKWRRSLGDAVLETFGTALGVGLNGLEDVCSQLFGICWRPERCPKRIFILIARN